MPNPYVYTARRRVIMQVVMIAIFAATMGLAAVVRSSRVSVPPIVFDPPTSIGLFDVAIPKEWTTRRLWRSSMPPVPVLLALDDAGHKLKVAQHYLGYDITREAFLETFHDRKLDDGISGDLTIAGKEGLALTVGLEHKGEGGSSNTTHQFGILVIDKRLVLSVELESAGKYPTAVDRQLFREIVKSIRMKSITE